MAELPDEQTQAEPPADATDIRAASLSHLNNADCVRSVWPQQFQPHVQRGGGVQQIPWDQPFILIFSLCGICEA